MKRCSTMLLLGALAALWVAPVPLSPAQAPTEEELKELERQAEQLEKKQAEAAAKAAAKAEAKRKPARKQGEEERRAAEPAVSVGSDAPGRKRDAEGASALAGEFVDIPGGSFQMGCSPGDGQCDDDERPAHTVSIKPFRIGKYEVTVGQFRRFVEAAGYQTDAERSGSCWGVPADGSAVLQAGSDWRDPGFSQTDRHPVVCVSWNDAEAYAQWLSRQGGGRYRLPSESEWEYAARAGGGRRYSFGDSEAILCDYGNVADRTAWRQFRRWYQAVSCDDGALYTAPVGGYRANRFGLYGTHGNVWEWTEDCYHDSYAGAPSDGAAWTAGDCAGRVLRGGAWSNMSGNLRSSYRLGIRIAPGPRATVVGFRLLQDR